MEYLLLNQESFDHKIIEAMLKNAKSETEANLILNSLALIKSLKPKFKLNKISIIQPTAP